MKTFIIRFLNRKFISYNSELKSFRDIKKFIGPWPKFSTPPSLLLAEVPSGVPPTTLIKLTSNRVRIKLKVHPEESITKI